MAQTSIVPEALPSEMASPWPSAAPPPSSRPHAPRVMVRARAAVVMATNGRRIAGFEMLFIGWFLLRVGCRVVL